MAKVIMIDQFHLSLFVPRELSGRECNSIQAKLDSPSCQRAFVRAIRTVMRNHPALAKVQFTLTR